MCNREILEESRYDVIVLLRLLCPVKHGRTRIGTQSIVLGNDKSSIASKGG